MMAVKYCGKKQSQYRKLNSNYRSNYIPPPIPPPIIPPPPGPGAGDGGGGGVGDGEGTAGGGVTKQVETELSQDIALWQLLHSAPRVLQCPPGKL